MNRTIKLAGLLISLLAAPAAAWQWNSVWPGPARECAPMQRADGLILLADPTAYEGSLAAAQKRDHDIIFGVGFALKHPPSKCIRIAWKVEPWGTHPVNAADFWGKLPSGTMDLFDDSDHGDFGGEVQFSARDDGVREGAETLRIVLLDPRSNIPLRGSLVFYSAANAREQHGDNIVFTVLDPPE